MKKEWLNGVLLKIMVAGRTGEIKLVFFSRTACSDIQSRHA
jgi:hypothetical protein